jgi:hypothetical protein
MDQKIHKEALDHLIAAYQLAADPKSARESAEKELRQAIDLAQKHATLICNYDGPAKSYRYLGAFKHHVAMVNQRLKDKEDRSTKTKDDDGIKMESIARTMNKSDDFKVSDKVRKLREVIHKSIEEESSLSKGKFGRLMAAASLLSGLAHTPMTPEAPRPHHADLTTHESPQFQRELSAISMNESSGGKNLQHPTQTSGIHEGQTAGGEFGIMPIIAKETIEHHPDLKSKYGHLIGAPHQEVTKYLNQDRQLSHDIAVKHWSHLRSMFPKEQAAYAWRKGIHGASTADPKDIEQSEYVKNFISRLK